MLLKPLPTLTFVSLPWSRAAWVSSSCLMPMSLLLLHPHCRKSALQGLPYGSQCSPTPGCHLTATEQPWQSSFGHWRQPSPWENPRENQPAQEVSPLSAVVTQKWELPFLQWGGKAKNKNIPRGVFQRLKINNKPHYCNRQWKEQQIALTAEGQENIHTPDSIPWKKKEPFGGSKPLSTAQDERTHCNKCTYWKYRAQQGQEKDSRYRLPHGKELFSFPDTAGPLHSSSTFRLGDRESEEGIKPKKSHTQKWHCDTRFFVIS